MIEVLEPGLLTTIQDIGRIGYQRYGVIVSGAMDTVALRIANRLVGNRENTGCLEMTLLGPELRVDSDTLVAVTGEGLRMRVNGDEVPGWRPVFVKAGSVLKFQPQKVGCRSYLAVAGGIDVPQVMGSVSTTVRSEIGGFQGRALRRGDELPVGDSSAIGRFWMQQLSTQLLSRNRADFLAAGWSVSDDVRPRYRRSPVVRVVWGNQASWFTSDSREQFQRETFQLTSQSDRMGYRLNGPQLELQESRELVSEAVTIGTIQVPAGGNPIVLMADRQTTGGYPKIAQVARIDLGVVAQMRPGSAIRFEIISVEKAQALWRRQEDELAGLDFGLHLFERAGKGG